MALPPSGPAAIAAAGANTHNERANKSSAVFFIAKTSHNSALGSSASPWRCDCKFKVLDHRSGGFDLWKLFAERKLKRGSNVCGRPKKMPFYIRPERKCRI